MRPDDMRPIWKRLADRMSAFARNNAATVDLTTEEGMRVAVCSCIQTADHADMLWDGNDPQDVEGGVFDICDGYSENTIVPIQTAYSAPTCYAAFVPEDLEGFVRERAEKGVEFDSSEHDFEWVIFGCEHAARDARDRAMGDVA